MFRQLAVAIDDASEAQSKALAITPKIVAIFSLIGSSILIHDIVSNGRFRKKLYHSILLGMSITDALCSLAFFFTTWPIPPEVLPLWGASGTQLTCTVQGWFTQFSISAICYSGFLALHYLLVIRLGWTERRLRDARLAFIIHLCSISMGVLTSSISAGLGLLNPIGWDCWIASVPLGCAESWQNEQTTCTRGDNATLFQWLFFYGPLWFTIVFVTIVMYLVCSTYIRNFRKGARWSMKTSLAKHRSNAQSGVNPNTPSAPSRQEREKSSMKTQMMLYVGSFYMVWLFPTILRFTELFGDTVWYHWVFLSACSVPSQGIFNAIVYLRPRWLKAQEEEERKSRASTKSRSVPQAAATEYSKGRESSIQQSPVDGEDIKAPKVVEEEGSAVTWSTVKARTLTIGLFL